MLKLTGDAEAELIVRGLSRATIRDAVLYGSDAKVYIDDSGRLCILFDGEGLLFIYEDDLKKVHGDLTPHVGSSSD